MKLYIMFIYFLLSACSVNLLAEDIPTIPDLEGYWLNADPDTTGITRITIGKDADDRLVANIFGHCFPIECKWEPLIINNYGQPMPVLAEHHNSFKSAYLSFNLATLTIMELGITTVFLDNNSESGNYEASYIFFKDASVTTPVRIITQ